MLGVSVLVVRALLPALRAETGGPRTMTSDEQPSPRPRGQGPHPPATPRWWPSAQLDLEVEEGEFVALVGPNGAGKSTLLACVAGLLEPSEGEVRVARRPGRLAPGPGGDVVSGRRARPLRRPEPRGAPGVRRPAPRPGGLGAPGRRPRHPPRPRRAGRRSPGPLLQGHAAEDVDRPRAPPAVPAAPGRRAVRRPRPAQPRGPQRPPQPRRRPAARRWSSRPTASTSPNGPAAASPSSTGRSPTTAPPTRRRCRSSCPDRRRERIDV